MVTYVAQLAKVGLLTTLSADEKMRLARALSTEEYGADEAIVREGEGADCMYFLQVTNHLQSSLVGALLSERLFSLPSVRRRSGGVV